MKNTKIRSIKARLLTYLVSFIVLVWMAVAFSSLLSMQKGASQIVDMQLEQLAKALAEMPSFTDTDIHDEEEKIFHEKSTQASPVYFQIWRNGNIDISTYKLELIDIQNIPEGFSKRQIKNESWRLRDKIFERFYRGKNKQNPEGSGLGLSIVKRIAEINGIDINLKSNQKNDGTYFQFIFYN